MVKLERYSSKSGWGGQCWDVWSTGDFPRSLPISGSAEDHLPAFEKGSLPQLAPEFPRSWIPIIYLFIFWDYGSPLKRAIFCQQIRTDSGRSTWRGTHVLYIHENRGGGEKSTRREVIFHLMGVKALGKVGSCRPVHQSIQSTWRFLRQKPSSLTWKGTMAFPRRQKKPLFTISSVKKIQVELYQHLLQNRNHPDVAQVPGSLRLGRWLKFSRRNLKLDKNKTWSFKEVKNQKPNQWWVKSSSDGWRDGWVVGVCLCV